MKKSIYHIAISVLLTGALLVPVKKSMAGNEDRAGQAGAAELLVNPWARSSGWGGVNTANGKGLDALYTNVAGLAFTERTEVIFSHTQWLKGTGINIASFGFSQKIGETGVLGLSVMSMSLGDIMIRTVDQPEGGIGTFSPNLMNINLSYAKAFSAAIYGGINIKIISESVADIGATGIAIDAGIQYVTGPTDNVHFGISMKNVGPNLNFSGDGFTFRGTMTGNDVTHTISERSVPFELPSLINIGAAYDFNLSKDHKLTAAANFTSNSFTKDQYIFGMEYNFMNYLMLRGGYVFEKDIFDKAKRTTALTGACAGISIQAPLNKEKGSTISIDYSYRATDPFDGCHTIGARINL
jgi:hypothetical protein